MKHTLLALFALLLAAPAVAGGDWKTYFESKEVKVLYCYTDCHDEANGLHQQKILLKFINLQNKAVEVSYGRQLQFSNKQSTSPDVKQFTVNLAANATLQGDCTTKNNALFIFSKQLNFSSTQLEKFDLQSISVKSAQ